MSAAALKCLASGRPFRTKIKFDLIYGEHNIYSKAIQLYQRKGAKFKFKEFIVRNIRETLFLSLCYSPSVSLPLLLSLCFSPSVSLPLFLSVCFSPFVFPPLFLSFCFSPLFLSICSPLLFPFLIFSPSVSIRLFLYPVLSLLFLFLSFAPSVSPPLLLPPPFVAATPGVCLLWTGNIGILVRF